METTHENSYDSPQANPHMVIEDHNCTSEF